MTALLLAEVMMVIAAVRHARRGINDSSGPPIPRLVVARALAGCSEVCGDEIAIDNLLEARKPKGGVTCSSGF
jgi:hypothetical protein